jgi:DNA primase
MLGLDSKAARDSRACRSPFRRDRHPSISVYDNDRRWKDHGTGEGGNAMDFLAKARHLSSREACRDLIRLADVRSSDARPDLSRGI